MLHRDSDFMEELEVLKSLRFQERIDADRKDARGTSLEENMKKKLKAIKRAESRANK